MRGQQLYPSRSYNTTAAIPQLPPDDLPELLTPYTVPTQCTEPELLTLPHADPNVSHLFAV